MIIAVNALWLSIWTILVLSPAVFGEKWAWPDSHDSTGTSRSLYNEQQSDESVDVLRFRDTDNLEHESLNQYENPQFERCSCGFAYTCVAPGVLVDGCKNGKSLCCFGPKNGKSYDEESHNNGIYSEREASFYPNQLSGYGGSSNNILVGPSGPTGIIGPSGNSHNQYAESVYERPNAALIDPSSNNVLVGPGGPTGIIGPGTRQHSNGVLVGPGGPTGIIGPVNRQSKGVLVGPGGPTGIIGPANRQYSNGVLVGPGGPTGLIGPGYNSYRRPRYNRRPHANNGVLVGPGGPTGIIGPGGFRGDRYSDNGILVGPGGPTGIIGPRSRSLDRNTEFDDS